MDIGANIGTTSVYVKKVMDPGLHIIAFEPLPQIFKLLHINMLLNDIPETEYTLVNLGLSDQSEEKTMKMHKGNLGASSLLETDYNKKDSSVPVKTISFDEYISTNNIDIKNTGYIWVDIEGFEARFLSGAFHTLSDCRPPMVLEYTPALLKRSNTYDMFIEIISKLYSKYIILQTPNMVHDIHELQNESDRQVDLFFIR